MRVFAVASFPEFWPKAVEPRVKTNAAIIR
jgi:hypothetical protein